MKRLAAVEFTLKGLNAEKLMNAARAAGIPLWGAKRKENRGIALRCARKDYAAFRVLAEEKGFSVSEAKPVGVLKWGKRLFARPGLWLGALAGGALVLFAMNYVWQVSVENAGKYSAELSAALEEMNVRPGMRKDEINTAWLRERLEWRLPQVKWVNVDWAGCVLRVRLEEGTPAPETEEGSQRADVVASEDGVLKSLTAFAGTPVKKAGDFVHAGDILIRGEERGRQGETVSVKARGEAVARVWVSVKVRTMLTEWASYPTGREESRCIWNTPHFAWSDSKPPDYLTCDREDQLLPLGGAWLPVWLKRERYQEVELRKEARNLEEAKEEAARGAMLALNQALFSHEIVDKWINFSMIEGDTITVTATAEALKSIGRCRKY